MLQNDTFINETEQLPPLPDSIPNTPSSSIVLPDRTQTPEPAQRAQAPYQASIEDDPDESTPTPTPGPSTEGKREPSKKEAAVAPKAEAGLDPPGEDKARTKGERILKSGDNSRLQAGELPIPVSQLNQPQAGEKKLPSSDAAGLQPRNKEQKSVPLPLKARTQVALEAPSPEMVQKPYPPRVVPSTQSSAQPLPTSLVAESVPVYQYAYANVEAQQRPTSPQMPGGFPIASGAPGSPKPLPAPVPSPDPHEERHATDSSHIIQPYGYPPQPYYSRASYYAQPYYSMPFYPSNAERLERSGSDQGRGARPGQNEVTFRNIPKEPPNAVPDMSLLLTDYRAAQDQLNAKERQNQEAEKALTREVEDLKRQLSAHRSEFAKVLNDTILERNKERNESARFRADREGLKKELDQATVQISILTANVGQIISDRDQVKRECSSLHDKMAGHQRFVQECNSLRLEVAGLQDRKREDAEELARTQKDRSALKSAKKALEQDLDGFKKELASQKDSHEQRLAAEREGSRKQVDGARNDLKSQKDAHERLLAHEQEKLRKQQESLQSDLLAQKVIHERAMTEEREKLAKEVSAKEESIRRMGHDHKVELSRLTGEVSDLRKKYNLQCHDLDNWRLYDVDQRRKLDRMGKELREAREKHSDEIKSLQKAFDEERARINQQAKKDIERLHHDHESQEHKRNQEAENMPNKPTETQSEVQRAFDVQSVSVQSAQDERDRRLQVTESLHRMEDILAQLNNEKGRLNRNLQLLGHTKDFETKGDKPL